MYYESTSYRSKCVLFVIVMRAKKVSVFPPHCSSFYFHFYLHIHFYISSSSWYWMLYSAWHVIQIKFILCTHFFLWHLVVCFASPSRKSNSLIYIFKCWWKTIKAYFVFAQSWDEKSQQVKVLTHHCCRNH